MTFFSCLLLTALYFSPILSIITRQAMDDLRQQQSHCLRLSGVTKDQLEMARIDRRIHEEENLEKFAGCLLNKFRIMNADGTINHDSGSYVLITDDPGSFLAARKCATLASSVRVYNS
ncbi:uncharacterized protein LOC131673885 isoform X3 [Phymastichus coffea]|uniref:uncharacterized protein LOC131673885 isoform X3 n=1 Tax=Phymastichus coffea TaxID=108790 RepID=UPI00273BF565|nr:uncharacterized protein LOC131673885 isoform X3 [Phymastichus coffea]